MQAEERERERERKRGRERDAATCVQRRRKKKKKYNHVQDNEKRGEHVIHSARHCAEKYHKYDYSSKEDAD